MPGLIGQHLPTVFVPNPPLGSSTLLFDNTGVLSIKRNDGSVETVGSMTSVEIINNQLIFTEANGATFGASGSFTGLTGPAGYLDISYSQFLNGLTQSSLTPSYYRINDFMTRGWILGSTDSASYSGTPEALIVWAASGSCFPEAKSELFPQDYILYDPFPDNWLVDRSFSEDGVNIIPDFKGVIYSRKDLERDIVCSFDWRNALVRRWKLDYTTMGLTSWGPGTWSRNDMIEDSNGVAYYCLETHNTDGSTGTFSYNPNQYYATSSTSDWLEIRNNVRYHWMRLFEKDLYLLPLWQSGTISTTYSLGFGVYPDSAPWGPEPTFRTLDLTIDQNSYEDFNVFGIHGTTSIKSDIYDLKMILSKEQSIQSFGSIVLTNRIESNKEVFKLTIDGSNLTIYDDVPILPVSIFQNTSGFLQNTFTNFERILLYGDEWVTSDNADLDGTVNPLWTLNSFNGNCDIFGFSFNNIINTNGINSTFEDSYLLNLNLCAISSLRSSPRLNSDLMFRTSLLNVSSSKLYSSNGNYFIGVNSSDIMESVNNRFELNTKQVVNTVNSELGPQFENNLIGPNGINNTVISSRFENNYFYGISDSEIGSNINGLTGSTTSSIQNTIIESDSISGIDLSSATHIYSDYGTTIYKRPDVSARLRYWDDFDAFQVVSATA